MSAMPGCSITPESCAQKLLRHHPGDHEPVAGRHGTLIAVAAGFRRAAAMTWEVSVADSLPPRSRAVGCPRRDPHARRAQLNALAAAVHFGEQANIVDAAGELLIEASARTDGKLAPRSVSADYRSGPVGIRMVRTAVQGEHDVGAARARDVAGCARSASEGFSTRAPRSFQAEPKRRAA
ncbi:hypothetical protein [Streptomyces sp. NPDC005476]|uniref:hypothetical protein n=1 Tax=Streptomyces sp. NPDC005476 TaxID=3156882 RepID=UPI0034528A02